MPTPRRLLVGLGLVAAVVTILGLGEPALCQAFLAPLAPTPAATSTAPRLETIGSRARRTLAQFDALVAPTDDDAPIEWDEALDLLEQLILDSDNKLVADEAEPGRYVPLRDHCHARIAALPPDGRQAYRDRVDPAARRLFDRGRETRDVNSLRRVVDEYFGSRWGDDALLLLGDLALERGDTTAARRHWRRIARDASDPRGLPLAWALGGLDLSTDGEQVAEILSSAPNVGLTHPDSDVPLADVLARLALAELYDQKPDAARAYQRLIQIMAPESVGALAGQTGRLAEIADRLINAAEDWPTPAEQPIGPLYGRMWPQPIPLEQAPEVPPQPRAIVIGGQLRFSAPKQATSPTPTCRPTVAGSVVVYRSAGVLRAVDLENGKPTLGPNGELHRITAPARPNTQNLQNRLLARGRVRSRFQLPDGELLALQGDRLFARVAQLPTPGGGDGPMVRAFDLAREGLESPAVAPVEAPWRLGGAPTPDRTRLYVPLVADEVTPRIALAAYSTATGRELWRTPIATGAADANYAAVTAPQVMATLAGDTLYLNTNVGAVAAIDAVNGNVRWVRLYDRAASATPTSSNAPRSVAGCLVAGSRVLVSPNDCERVLALDAATGRLMWASEEFTGGRQLLGVHGETLIFGGDQVRGLDLDTGRARYTWPETRKSGLRGMGRGCLVAGEVFWPTRTRLLVLDADTGAPTRLSIDIADLGGTGANVVPAGEMLLVAGAKAMTLLGPENREQTNSNQPLLSSTD